MNPYRLIDCSFHDELEALAALRKPCEIQYRDAENMVQMVSSIIIDVYSAKGADFIKLQAGTVIRADYLIAVDGKPIQFANSPFSCA